jgi:hypothetical protein
MFEIGPKLLPFICRSSSIPVYAMLFHINLPQAKLPRNGTLEARKILLVDKIKDQ